MIYVISRGHDSFQSMIRRGYGSAMITDRRNPLGGVGFSR